MEHQVNEALVSAKGEPVWEIARLFPRQGHWSVEEYLALETNAFIEYSHGYIEVLPMPTMAHQLIVSYLFQALLAFVRERLLGTVLFAPLPVHLSPEQYREPDIIYLSRERRESIKGDYPQSADLVVEVVSGRGKDRQRDLVTKREDYARAGIPEYWIVDPEKAQITVLRLQGEAYAVHGQWKPGEEATSALLEGFRVDVAAVFAAAEQ